MAYDIFHYVFLKKQFLID